MARAYAHWARLYAEAAIEEIQEAETEMFESVRKGPRGPVPGKF